MRLSLTKFRTTTVLLLILTAVTLSSSIPLSYAQTSINIEPSEGNVGSSFIVTANITTSNGTYQILWDEGVIASGNATDSKVNVTLTVPPSFTGNHSVTVVDTSTSESSAAIFHVVTSYSLEILPKREAPSQLQEGDRFNISLKMTGGQQSAISTANVTIKAPNNASYTSLGNVTTESDGNGTLFLSYPADFPIGANTNYTGDYHALLNGTLAMDKVFIGLTNSSEYHRNQTLNVKAVYDAYENVTLTITGKDLNYTADLAADDQGFVVYLDSSILANTSLGSYMVNITSKANPAKKTPNDVQNFTVPGFNVNMTTKNLADEAVANVVLRIFENVRSVVNTTSGSDGLAYFKLELGSYLCNASYNGQIVGLLNMEVNDAGSFDLICNLTNLRATVVDEDGVHIPEINLELAPENQTFTSTISSTDINGVSVAHSLLPLVDGSFVNYTLNASRHGTLFNTTTSLYLPIASWFDITIICPKLNLQVNVTDSKLRPISNARVNITDVKGGLHYSGTTDSNGLLNLSCTLGKYVLEVLDVSGIMLKETALNLNMSIADFQIVCHLYGLDVSVNVVDYFGQGISNVNVTLQRTELALSRLAGADGLATFADVIGGQMEVLVRLPRQEDPCVLTTLYINSSGAIVIKIERYIVFAGMLVEASNAAVVIVVLGIALFIFSLEVYRRRRLKR